MTVIKDGTGTGYLAKVDSEGHLTTHSTSRPEFVFINDTTGQYFAATTGVVTANSTNEHAVLYIENLSSTLNLYVDAWVLSYNGGSTDHNRCCRIRVYKNCIAPTANHTQITLPSLNWSKAILADTIAYKWDGVGDGMTKGSAGTLIFDSLFRNGLTQLQVSGSPILNQGNSVTVSYTPEQIGTFATVMRFYMREQES